MKVPVVRNILEANDRIAEQNREMFDQHNIFVLNLMSSPGAGKTSLLERTIEHLKDRINIGIIEGDIQSSYDAERIAQKGVEAVQINTGGACHLDGNMIREAVSQFDLDKLNLLVVENVGNLVCPAEFNVGEDMKIMILSVPEGDDKPLKYPLMFSLSKALIINKIDLLPYVDCSVEKIRDEASKLSPGVEIFEVSCRTGEGLEAWYEWVEKLIKDRR
ncbi:MAG: hydrogenase nickel incorporation protein HypB [Deltaproteobacteria bacterium]|nr:hydrogenase nickel incorporation protein HypB [Deltaproteobacteria bacterium]MBW2051662.1 hydrogenase nickel incorporation protein HypB [Deltaproteobacteria bacterium]MBW2140235.1 hydrogenase nickel incorporation protein HypB [Deltaproteobacteria bacterium]MBW2323433.1 hydrogenase nickel incorporation protein HypB [Deltaproteobacteria bacterium]